MHVIRLSAYLVLALATPATAAPLKAPEPPGAAPFAPIPAAHTAAMLANYPPKARAAGVEGKAAIDCRRMLHGAPDQCEIVSEDPGDFGFGRAALALAARAPQNPALPILPEKKQLWHIDFTFKLKPLPAITPDTLSPLHVPPRFDKFPSETQMLNVFPTAALSSYTDGFVILFCVIQTDGHLMECKAASNPKRFGFEAAALKLAPLFQAQTRTDDGASTAGQTITVPLLFSAP